MFRISKKKQKDIQQKMRSWRKARKLTQHEAARLYGVNQPQVSKWETGMEGIDLDAIASVARGMSLHDHGHSLIPTPDYIAETLTIHVTC